MYIYICIYVIINAHFLYWEFRNAIFVVHCATVLTNIKGPQGPRPLRNYPGQLLLAASASQPLPKFQKQPSKTIQSTAKIIQNTKNEPYISYTFSQPEFINLKSTKIGMVGSL